MKPAAALLAVSFIVFAAGCLTGADEVQGFAPRIELEALHIGDGGQAELVVLLLNPNDHPVFIESALLVLRLGGEVLFERNARLDLDVGAQNRERVRLEAGAGSGALARLRGLDDTPNANLAYELLSDLVLVGQRDARARVEGFLHPVPGQPGRYR